MLNNDMWWHLRRILTPTWYERLFDIIIGKRDFHGRVKIN